MLSSDLKALWYSPYASNIKKLERTGVTSSKSLLKIFWRILAIPQDLPLPVFPKTAIWLLKKSFISTLIGWLL